ncbi:MAG: carboxypeptidase-like regulatory domain-containing protein, partial [Dehalococcoidia bacterium]
MGIKRCFLLFLTGLLVLLAFAPSAIAQGTSGIKAKVIDKDGNPLPSARVTVTNPTLGITQAVITDADGAFRIVPLKPGKGYSIEIAFPGMSTIVLPDVELTVNRVATMPPITLRPKSEVDQSIRVTATREVVDTSSTSTNTSFSSEFIDSLPILGRNYQ